MCDTPVRMQNENAQSLPRAWGWLMPALLALVVAWFCWEGLFNPKIPFLPPDSAPWIVYPSPPQGRMLDATPLPAEFHFEFVLAQKPSQGMLDWRCFRRGQIIVNGQTVAKRAADNWKQASQLDVTGQLRQGTNEIEATVWAATGFPALSLRLQTDEGAIETDEAWDVSLAGALRLPADRAGALVEPRRGNSIFGFETTGVALGKTFGIEVVFLVVALAAMFFWRRLRAPRWAWIGLAVAWALLLAHNIACLTVCLGFDARAHLAYVDYILQNGSLPSASQGLEMFQAPLYYILSSNLLYWLHATATTPGGLLVLRVFNLAVGAANVALVYAGLRMIYPVQWRKQIAGAALAAFAPWHLYLLHYTTNEVLCGALGTACVVLGLKCARTEKPIWLAALGAALGAACLTKASAVALAPVLGAMLAGRLIAQKERSPVVWLKTMGLVFGLALAISGWHYWRLWRQYGNPLTGGWNPAMANPWWQQPGCIIPSYFMTFGQALISPFFSGMHSFWDGLYSTLWGDGLGGGGAGFIGRAPWNYDLMTVGFVLALAPSFLLVSGIVVSMIRFVRRPRLDWLLLGGVAMIYLLALAHMSLKLPYYGHAKAFFALAALLPFCALILEGHAFWAGRLGAGFRVGLLTALGLWLINDYAAFWIKPNGSQTRLLTAMDKYYFRQDDAAPDFTRVLTDDPHNDVALEYLALAEQKAGRSDRFAALVNETITNNPADDRITSFAAADLGREGKWEEALKLAEKAAHNSPDDGAIARTWLHVARESGRGAEIMAAGEWLLRDEPGDAEAHATMADVLGRMGRTNAAAMHLSIGKEDGFESP
jgi:hypothetical protein